MESKSGPSIAQQFTTKCAVTKFTPLLYCIYFTQPIHAMRGYSRSQVINVKQWNRDSRHFSYTRTHKHTVTHRVKQLTVIHMLESPLCLHDVLTQLGLKLGCAEVTNSSGQAVKSRHNRAQEAPPPRLCADRWRLQLVTLPSFAVVDITSGQNTTIKRLGLRCL